MVSIKPVTLTTSTTANGSPNNLLNGVLTDFWWSGTSAAPTNINLDFGSPTPLARILYYPSTASDPIPKSRYYYSDDGTNYNLIVDDTTGIKTTSQTWLTYALPDVGSHRYWRIYGYSPGPNGGVTYLFKLGELNFDTEGFAGTASPPPSITYGAIPI